jgi:hypothetical protein
MSVAELKEQLAELSPEERSQIIAFLAEMEHPDEAAYHAELDRRMKAMDAGEKIYGDEVERLHEKLKAEGR